MNKVNGGKLLADAKKEVSQSKEEYHFKPRPWYVNFLIWICEVVAVISLLALAILGAMRLFDGNISQTIQLGLSVLVVGLLASRPIERLFK